jgi:hypothetical protein
VENVAPAAIVVVAALEIDCVNEVATTGVVFTPTALEVEVIIVEGVAVIITVLCVGVTALLWPWHTENISVPFDLDV